MRLNVEIDTTDLAITLVDSCTYEEIFDIIREMDVAAMDMDFTRGLLDLAESLMAENAD